MLYAIFGGNSLTRVISDIFTEKNICLFLYIFSVQVFPLTRKHRNITNYCCMYKAVYSLHLLRLELCLCVSESVVAGPRPVAAWSEDRTVAMFSSCCYGCWRTLPDGIDMAVYAVSFRRTHQLTSADQQPVLPLDSLPSCSRPHSYVNLLVL